jgi:pSer/pThr/pTyr-binding forkhead associated (FHA) protein
VASVSYDPDTPQAADKLLAEAPPPSRQPPRERPAPPPARPAASPPPARQPARPARAEAAPAAAIRAEPAAPRSSLPAGHARSEAAGAVCERCGAALPGRLAFCGVCGASAKGRSGAVAPAGKPIGFLALIDDVGAEARRFPLAAGEHRVGRSPDSSVAFPDDGLLALVHATVHVAPKRFRVVPVDQVNGTFLRISTPVELRHGEVMRIGQEVLRFERLEELRPEINAIDGQPFAYGTPLPRGVWGRLSQFGMSRQICNAYLLSSRDVFLGRERGDILFPKDGFVSGSHAVVSERSGRVYLKDLGSSNGTFLRLRQEVSLRNGDLLLMGRSLLRVIVGGE